MDSFKVFVQCAPRMANENTNITLRVAGVPLPAVEKVGISWTWCMNGVNVALRLLHHVAITF